MRRGCLVILSVLCFVAPAAHADMQVSLTPRFTFYFDDSTSLSAGVNGLTPRQVQATLDGLNVQLAQQLPGAAFSVSSVSTGIATQQALYRLYGATVTFDWGTTQAAITALTGQAHQFEHVTSQVGLKFNYQNVVATDILSGVEDADAKLRRIDLEGTLQHRVSEHFSLMGGLRYESVRFDSSGTVQTNLSNNATNIIAVLTGQQPSLVVAQSDSTVFGSGRLQFFSARAGGALLVPINERQSIYSNGLLQVTYQPALSFSQTTVPITGTTSYFSRAQFSSFFSLGPDLSIGYAYRMNERFTLDVRYRAIIYFAVSNGAAFDQPRVNQGLYAGVSVSLGK